MSVSLRVVVSWCVLALLFPAARATGQTHATRRSSLTAANVEALGFSNSPSVSESGRFVVFPSNAGNLVLPDTNAEFDIFVKDLVLGTVTRVTNGLAGAPADGASKTGNAPAISDDGRYMVFASDATNLVANDDNFSSDVFRHNRVTGQTVLVSLNPANQPFPLGADRPSISGDGRFVTFQASDAVYRRNMATNTTVLVSVENLTDDIHMGGTDSALTTDGAQIVFATTGGASVRDVAARTTRWVSVLPAPLSCASLPDTVLPSISGTGRYVTFNCGGQAWVRDRDADADGIFDETGTASVTRRIDESAAGVPADISNTPTFPRITKNGRFIAFTSEATNLLGPGGDGNGLPDVFVADVDGDGDGVFYEAGDRRVWRASVASDGTPQSDASPSFLRVADISDDGRFTAFNSIATNLVAADTNDLTDIFVYDHYAWRVADLFTPTTETMTPQISGNGMWTAFASEATTLVTGDSNNLSDVFVRDRRKAMGTAGSVVRVSVATGGTQAIGGVSDQPSISHDGRFIVFRSTATNLVAGDTNGLADIFLHDRDVDRDGIFDEAGARATYRISVATGGVQATGGASETPHISPDGRFIVFSSLAANLAGAVSNVRQVYLHLRLARSTERISQVSGAAANADAVTPVVANNGIIAFATAASNLSAQDGTGTTDIYVSVPDAQGSTRTLWLKSRVQVSTGNFGAGGSTWPSLSPDGLVLAYQSTSALIADNDTNGVADIFVTSAPFLRPTLRVSETRAHNPATGASVAPAISGKVGTDIWVVSYTSGAPNLVFGDTNGVDDVFATDVHGQGTTGSTPTFTLDPLTATARISLSPAGQQLTTGSGASSISADGTRIEFERPLATGGGASAVVVEALLDGKSTSGERTPTPIVRSLDPDRGPSGTIVLITGEGLDAPDLVPFLGNAAMPVLDRGPDFIRAEVPPGSGVQPLGLAAPALGNGKSAGGFAFTYAACSVTATLQSSQVGAGGGSVTLAVNDPQNCGWSVDVEEDWLQRTPAQGRGNANVTVTAGPNGEPGQRTGHIRAAGAVLNLQQAGQTCTAPQFSSSSANHGSGGGSGTFQLTTISGCPWQLQTSGAVQVTSATSGDVSDPISYDMPANPTTLQRTATISVPGGPTFTITQQGLPTFTLTVNRTGGGTVTSSPPAIACGSTCSASLASGSTITLIPTADSGFNFVSWSGDCTGTNSCVLTMNGPRSVTATFEQAPPGTFSLDVSVTQGGSVTSSPSGIACPGDCNETFNSGTTVTLTPTPAAGFLFSQWSGTGCTGGVVQMTQNRSCTATFVQDLPTTRVLTVIVVGSGTVTSIPAGISCGQDCTEAFTLGATVTLMTTPAAGFTFGGWSAGCGATVQMTQDRSCTATFNPPRTLTVAVVGSGTVTSIPIGINCGQDCSEAFTAGTNVTLVTSAAAGFTFGGWSGAGCGATVQMTQDRSCTATFTQNPPRTLTVTVVGSGTVTSTPPGINCGADCTEALPSGTAVSLVATPAAGQQLQAWSGACSGTANCVVQLDQSLSVTATFVAATGTNITVTGISPSSGLASGGTKVRIRGTGFDQPGAVSVTLAGVPVPALTVVNDSLLVVVAPSIPAAAAVTHEGVATPVATGSVVVSIAGATATLSSAWRAVALDGSTTTDTDGDGLPDYYEALFSLDVLAADSAADPDGDGMTNLQEWFAVTHPQGHYTRYLAEGATGAFFDTRLSMANPSAVTATIVLRFQTEAATSPAFVWDVPGQSRRSWYPRASPDLAATSFSTVVESDIEIAVDRSMFWDRNIYGSTAETSVAAPGTTWYLAEGATGGPFDVFYLIQNPDLTRSADIRIRFLLPSAAPIVKTYTVAPRQRFTLNIDQIQGLENTDVSAAIESVNGVPVIVERSMYVTRNELWSGGHNSAAVPAPALNWFLAEGATGSFFDTFVLVANPNTSPADLRVTYMRPDGSTIERNYSVPGERRLTIWVDQQDPRLANTSVATRVESTNNVGVIVERAMWWPGPDAGFAAVWAEAHNSFGSTETGTVWALADGETGPAPVNTRTYVLVANTSPFPATVRLTLLSEGSAAPRSRSYTIPANSRFTVGVHADFPDVTGGYGCLVESLGDVPAEIVVERAMYSDSSGVFWAAGTNVLATKIR